MIKIDLVGYNQQITCFTPTARQTNSVDAFPPTSDEIWGRHNSSRLISVMKGHCYLLLNVHSHLI